MLVVKIAVGIVLAFVVSEARRGAASARTNFIVR